MFNAGVLALAARSGRRIAVAHQGRLAPATLRLKRRIDEGLIGDLLEIRVHGKQDKRAGGEDMLVLGTHQFDLVRFFAGDPSWCSARVLHDGRDIVRADARTVVLREIDERQRALLIYTDERAGKVHQLLRQPHGTLVMWSPALGWQLRCRVRLVIEMSGLAASSPVLLRIAGAVGSLGAICFAAFFAVLLNRLRPSRAGEG